MTSESKPAPIPSRDTRAMLGALQQAVAEALERKRRLGQYAVQWSDDGPVLFGEDAPTDWRQG